MKRSGALALLFAALTATPSYSQAPKSDPKTEAVHVVQPGETLGGIASRAEVPRVLIIEANGLKEPYALKAGQKLVIPRRRSHTVKDGETGFDVAMTYGVPWADIAAANGLKSDARIKPGQKLAIPTVTAVKAAPQTTPAPTISTEPSKDLPDTAAPAFKWPVTGKLRRAFLAAKDGKTGHDGIDVLAEEGTAVRAAAAGKVIFAGQGPEEYGLTVIVWHSGRWTTTYSYLSKITVKEGDPVKAGERIGLIGETGLAEEPQLHFEIRRNKIAQDPARYLPKPR
jgi:murein DD-endopeptidase MepM/ murein hydrolase activator NlpD